MKIQLKSQIAMAALFLAMTVPVVVRAESVRDAALSPFDVSTPMASELCIDHNDCPHGAACTRGVCTICEGEVTSRCTTNTDCTPGCLGNICVDGVCVAPSDVDAGNPMIADAATRLPWPPAPRAPAPPAAQAASTENSGSVSQSARSLARANPSIQVVGCNAGAGGTGMLGGLLYVLSVVAANRLRSRNRSQ